MELKKDTLKWLPHIHIAGKDGNIDTCDFCGMDIRHRNHSGEDIDALILKLLHHRDSSVGLWATDQPDRVIDKDKIMFEITFN